MIVVGCWLLMTNVCCFRTWHLRASGLVVKSNVAIVGPRVRFPAGACAWYVLILYIGMGRNPCYMESLKWRMFIIHIWQIRTYVRIYVTTYKHTYVRTCQTVPSRMINKWWFVLSTYRRLRYLSRILGRKIIAFLNLFLINNKRKNISIKNYGNT